MSNYAHLFPEELDFVAAARRRPGASAGVRARRHELVTAPLVTLSALARAQDAFPQRGLLGTTTASNERVYFNANTPSSGVVCGVQGAGKSHTVSCILENALLADRRIGNLPQPLAALVFHFDEQDGDRPCEAAFLSASSPYLDDAPHVPRVTVLASPSNIAGRRRAYAGLRNVDVRPLYLAESELTAPRMLALMGWSDDSERMPLYLHTVMQIVRDIGCEDFSYAEFREQLKKQKFDVKQQMMLNHRMRLLDSFLSTTAESITSTFVPGNLVVVDLTDPFLDGVTASILFDIVLGTFMSWTTTVGKIVVLDEAHKYLTNSDSARLNRSIASIIRQQRHLATRVIIATQEPTVIPATILDLASFIMCHRFTSPSWCAHLAKHVSTGSDSWLADVMGLATGDALVFAPGALATRDGAREPVLLGRDALRIHVRPRLTCDGGASLLAVSTDVEDIRSILPEESLPTPRSARSPAFSSPVIPSPASLPSELGPVSQRIQGAPVATPSRPSPSASVKRDPSPLPSHDAVPPHPVVSKSASVISAAPPPAKTAPKSATKTASPPSAVPARFRVLVDAMRQRGFGVGQHVLWTAIADMRCFDPLRGEKKWFRALVRAAAEAGVVAIGGPPTKEWLALRV
ncbi:hypothetical protein AURDEDRAFT_185401 [Auricularia subglabra TFB-10046 SS5]|nr:hypothetical protein AURDEDRAFT_185401 [Auricularia subglabra TFB-10046 SS5]